MIVPTEMDIGRRPRAAAIQVSDIQHSRNQRVRRSSLASNTFRHQYEPVLPSVEKGNEYAETG